MILQSRPTRRLASALLALAALAVVGCQDKDRRVLEHEGNTIVDLICRFESERLKVRVVFDSDNRVSGLWIQPPI